MAFSFPPIFLLPTHLQLDERQHLEKHVPTLTHTIQEADVFVGKISRRERALFELRRLGITIKTKQEPSDTTNNTKKPTLEAQTLDPKSYPDLDDTIATKKIQVVKLEWLLECLRSKTLLAISDYLLYEGESLIQPAAPEHVNQGVLELINYENNNQIQTETAKEIDYPPRADRIINQQSTETPSKRRKLESQSSHEQSDTSQQISNPFASTYSCQRSTPAKSPNIGFVTELKEIRSIRMLLGDRIGVRAYSTSIATLAAYPHEIRDATEISKLPGCSSKIADLFHKWKATGETPETASARTNSKIVTLRAFFNICGVGNAIAQQFYSKGWRDLDDVVEYGWDSLSRIQQIGVKYYDDFLQKIPRIEAEEISKIILQHAREMHPDFQMIIVGSYRRGKDESNDVDVILSHRDEGETLDLIERLVFRLEQSGFIKHTLSLWNKNSDRNQMPLTWKGEHSTWVAGFDTLDKALLVWQNPKKPDSPYRRVDIILSPWKTIGCAVLGWSGETTFQRDLRRYCKKEKRWKFDSSGIRSRETGSWVDVEGGDEPATSMDEAERRAFAGLGLEWREPSERCTG